MRSWLISSLTPCTGGRTDSITAGAVLAALPASFLFGVFWMALGPRTAFLIGASLTARAVLVLGLFVPGRKIRESAPGA